MQDSRGGSIIPGFPDAKYVGGWAGEGWSMFVIAQLGSELEDTRFF